MNTRRHAATCGAFSLLEVVLVLFVLALLASALAPSVRDIVERARLEAEGRAMDELAHTIERSFESTDLSGRNIAALPGTIRTTDTPTVFSTSTAAPATTPAGAWYAKIARLRGVAPAVASPPQAQPELARIVFNRFGRARFLFAGPDEPGRARFLLVSVAAPSEQLALPTYEPTAAWFDALWEHSWEERTTALPALWAARLAPADAAAWLAGPGGTSRLHRLVVRRIVLPKFTVSVNNNHPTEHAFVSYLGDTTFHAPANSGANLTPEILGGRLITIHRGPASPGVEVLRFHLHENAAVTLQ